MASETASEIKDIDVFEVDSVAREDGMQACDVSTLGMGKLVDVALQQEDFLVIVFVERDALDVIFKAAHVVHAAGAEQFAQGIDEPGAADSFWRHIADHAKADGAIVSNRHFFDGAIQSGHTTGNGSAFEGWAGGAGCRENAMLVAEDQLSVGADIHYRDEPVFMRQVDGQHAGGCIRSYVATDDRSAVDARLGMNWQKALKAGLDEAGGGTLAIGHFDFGDRLIRGLTD